MSEGLGGGLEMMLTGNWPSMKEMEESLKSGSLQ
jgi:hypothetical protein